MGRKYHWVQVVTGIYGVIYLAALYFASGVGVGFKLDDNQLTGYVLCAVLLVGLIGSLFSTNLTTQRWLVGWLALSSLALLLVTVFDLVYFNEAFWYFIFLIYLLPVEILWRVVDFFHRPGKG